MSAPSLPFAKQYTPDEIARYIQSWKEELELRNTAIYQLYLNAAMSGILTVVITIGLTFDKLAQLGWFERSLIGISLILLLLAVGNVMFGRVFVVNARITLLNLERQLVLQGPAALPPGALEELDANLNAGNLRAMRQTPVVYFLLAGAILLGTLGFFVVLVKS
jgi:hypothetical protein